jgi:diacylglycerol kinase family enzyme
LKQLEHACSHDDMTERKVVLIAGGDGSLATTVKFLRQSKIANQALIKGRISFVMLPFGTGNDGA